VRIANLFMSPPGKSGFKCRKRSRNAENRKLVVRLLCCRIMSDFIFYHGNTKGGKHETSFSLDSLFRVFVFSGFRDWFLFLDRVFQLLFLLFTTDLRGNFTDIKKLKFSLPAVLFWKAGVSP